MVVSLTAASAVYGCFTTISLISLSENAKNLEEKARLLYTYDFSVRFSLIDRYTILLKWKRINSVIKGYFTRAISVCDSAKSVLT